MSDLYVGNGIWDWMKPAEPRIFKVEDLYESFSPDMWPLLDKMLEDRPDLQDRIKKYKDEKSIQDKTLEPSKEGTKEC